jgi:LysR family transcriptional regulator, glycine cleavage system transcriptional activator
MKGLRAKLPPPNSIVAFEAAARHASFTSAAGELNVSQTAVSRQIKTLEEHLGFPVFRRAHRAVRLTGEGKRLYDAVMVGLDGIADTVVELQRNSRKPRLTIGTTFAFSSLWLIRRIPDFRARYPDVEMRFVTSDTELDLAGEGIDVGVRYGSGHWQGLSARRLFEADVFPVCSPSFLASSPHLRTAGDLLSAPLLELETSDPSSIAWPHWFERVGVSSGNMRPSLTFNNAQLAIQAALEGHGVVLGWTPYVNELLENGALVRPLDRVVKFHDAHYLITPERAKDRNSDIFSDWMVSQAGATLAPIALGQTSTASRSDLIRPI